MRRPLTLVVLAAVMTAACSSVARPAVEEWRPVWDRTVAGFPTIEELGDPPDRDVCGAALVELRSSSGNLQPTPDRGLDEPVRSWVELAEEIVFDCPPSSSVVPSLEFAYRELALIEAEIDAALDVASQD